MAALLPGGAPRAMVADMMGYASIGFWLFAQAPQVVKNYRLQSCDGLSLPFLCNWLFGDITNLVGCVLTKQLPFQTYLATYFCIIDFTLVVQYFHYRSPPAPRYGHIIYTSPHQSMLIHTAPAHLHAQTAPHERHASNSSSIRPSRPRNGDQTSPPNSAGTIRPSHSAHPSYAPRQHSERHAPPATASGSSSVHVTPGPELHVIAASPLPRDGSYQAIYGAALDVARAAERAEARRMSRSLSRPRATRHQSTTSNQLPLVEIDETGAGSPPANMLESFHSDMSAATSSSTASVSALASRARARDAMSMSTPALLDHRGRSLRRTGTGLALNVPTPPREEDGVDGLPAEGGQGVGVEHDAVMLERRARGERSASRSLSLARGSGGRGKGRRAAGVAFMSLGLLAFGRTGGGDRGAGGGRGGLRDRVARGGVLTHTSAGVSTVAATSTSGLLAFRHPYLAPMSAAPSSPNSTYILLDHPPHSDPPRPPPIDYQHLIGRISAWACTTLYLTSRLPQIWKNFQRKSVEGLSILLFLFAFLGNTTYVVSIVLNAPFEGAEGEANLYLLEALPYLLGSGGTLLFDLTIMLQSLIYGSSKPVHQPTYDRSASFSRRPLFRRRTTRFVEDGYGTGAGHDGLHRSASRANAHSHSHSQLNGYAHDHGERQALLGGSGVAFADSPTGEGPTSAPAQQQVRTRERSESPGVVMRGRK